MPDFRTANVLQRNSLCATCLYMPTLILFKDQSGKVPGVFGQGLISLCGPCPSFHGQKPSYSHSTGQGPEHEIGPCPFWRFDGADVSREHSSFISAEKLSVKRLYFSVSDTVEAVPSFRVSAKWKSTVLTAFFRCSAKTITHPFADDSCKSCRKASRFAFCSGAGSSERLKNESGSPVSRPSSLLFSFFYHFTPPHITSHTSGRERQMPARWR